MMLDGIFQFLNAAYDFFGNFNWHGNRFP
jgi:hypothetical protein